MASSGASTAIQVVLAIIIVALGYLLFKVIRDPQVEFEARERADALGRERMDDVRTALSAYRDANDAYPMRLDTLAAALRNDTTFVAPTGSDDEPRMQPFALDSLTRSARTGEPFNYEVVIERDSTGAELSISNAIYWLQDPGAEADSIGSRAYNPARRNAASWE